jgi:hypothetical protein
MNLKRPRRENRTKQDTDYALYYIHFEINGVSCNLIGSQECDFSTNRTPSIAIRAEIAPSFNQSH